MNTDKLSTAITVNNDNDNCEIAISMLHFTTFLSSTDPQHIVAPEVIELTFYEYKMHEFMPP